MRAEDHNRNAPFPASFGGAGIRRFTPRVRIVGGGMTGILAAFQAHRMGARNIELFEHLDHLGGVARPHLQDGREMREGCHYFGPEGDPIRTLLETHGARFVDFDNRFGAVSQSLDNPALVQDFGGPALAGGEIDLSPFTGRSLGDRLACYDEELRVPLARYVKWHVGCDPYELHGDAAHPLAINRVYPAGAPLDSLAQAKRSDPLADELFGIPRSLWGYTSNAKASLPIGGFPALFEQCRMALDAIGVKVFDRKFANPKTMLAEDAPGDTLVWAASPIPLFKAMDLPVPKAPARKFASYTFDVSWSGPTPIYFQNFTAQGACFRVYIYESAGAPLLTAECVSQCDESALTHDIHRVVDGFDGTLRVKKRLHSAVKPRWLYHSVETIDSLTVLRRALRARMGDRFVTGAWEAYAKGAKFVEVEADLQKALAITLALEAI
ncbi:MAG: NAD(P)-binding protein [Pseudomonadota bacterium]